MKRFHTEVGVAQDAQGHRVLLDGKPVRTRGGAPQIVPTAALAEALAAEWRAQPERIDPRAFPLRGLADYALDHVAKDRESALARALGFAETDTLCYRAGPDEPLFHRQQAIWEPLVAACEAAHGIRLERISGIIHRPQPQAALARLRSELARMDDFTLAGVVTLASLAASLTIGLAVLDPAADPEVLFAAANLEQDWQAERWGWEFEAETARAANLAAFGHAARFIQLARSPA